MKHKMSPLSYRQLRVLNDTKIARSKSAMGTVTHTVKEQGATAAAAFWHPNPPTPKPCQNQRINAPKMKTINRPENTFCQRKYTQ